MRDLCAMRRAGIAARLGHSMTVKTQHETLGEQELRLAACAQKNQFFGPRPCQASSVCKQATPTGIDVWRWQMPTHPLMAPRNTVCKNERTRCVQ